MARQKSGVRGHAEFRGEWPFRRRSPLPYSTNFLIFSKFGPFFQLLKPNYPKNRVEWLNRSSARILTLLFTFKIDFEIL